MNYIKEINAFYDWLETNSLSTSGIVLWHALMHINNKAGWIKEFGVATSVLCVKTGLAERTISKARNELKQKGRIDWRSRKGNRSALYIMLPLSAYHADNRADKDDVSASDADSCADNHADKCADSHADNRATLNKLNETKLNNNNNCSSTPGYEEQQQTIDFNFQRVMKVYQENIGIPSPIEVEKMKDWCNDLTPEVIIKAIEQAVVNRVFKYNYVESILKNWFKQGIKNAEQVEAYSLERQRKMQEKARGGGPNLKPSKFVNYKQREWDFEEIERLEREFLKKDLESSE